MADNGIRFVCERSGVLIIPLGGRVYSRQVVAGQPFAVRRRTFRKMRRGFDRAQRMRLIRKARDDGAA